MGRRASSRVYQQVPGGTTVPSGHVVPEYTAPVTLDGWPVALRRLAFVRLASVKVVPERSAPLSCVPVRFAPLRFVSVKLETSAFA